MVAYQQAFLKGGVSGLDILAAVMSRTDRLSGDITTIALQPNSWTRPRDAQRWVKYLSGLMNESNLKFARTQRIYEDGNGTLPYALGAFR